VVTKYKFNSIELKSRKIATILSVPFCPYHFLQYNFVRSPAHVIQVLQHSRSCRFYYYDNSFVWDTRWLCIINDGD